MSQSDHHLHLYSKVVNIGIESETKLDDAIKVSHSASLSSSTKLIGDSLLSRTVSVPLYHTNLSTPFVTAPLSTPLPFACDSDSGTKTNILCSNDTPLLKEQKIIDSIANPNSEDQQDTDALHPANYFDFLDDFVRFDVFRTGVSCFSGYTVGVQYEDDFLVGKRGTPCFLSSVCSSKSRVRLWHNTKAFEVEYLPRVSCIRPKDCTYEVKISGGEQAVGTIHFKEDLVHIYNACERRLSLRRKQGSNFYTIKTEGGDRLASVELFRGLRGDILYYGLSILGDPSSTDKALLIGLTIAMDIRQREFEMRCSLIWVPLCCILVIGLFSVLPWLYFYDDEN